MKKLTLDKWKAFKLSSTFFVLGPSLLMLWACEPLDLIRPSSRIRSQAVDISSKSASVKFISPKDRHAFHRWLVNEMQEQIFSKPVADKAGISGWANVLSQKASIEGVYHGFILSSEYAELEKGKSADIKALRFFGLEMALLDFPSAVESDPRVQSAAAVYLREKMGSSVFSLKRELGERILREAEKRKSDQEKLAAWYSGIVARWSKLDIPFGLNQRNEKDEVFHFNWAKENTLGMIQWELLNREHRILNRLGGIEFNPSGK